MPFLTCAVQMLKAYETVVLGKIFPYDRLSDYSRDHNKVLCTSRVMDSVNTMKNFKRARELDLDTPMDGEDLFHKSGNLMTDINGIETEFREHMTFNFEEDNLHVNLNGFSPITVTSPEQI